MKIPLMKISILFFCLWLSQSLKAGNFEQFITYVNLLPQNERQAKIVSQDWAMGSIFIR